MGNLELDLNNVDNGRFKDIFSTLTIKSICADCSYYNYKATDSYRCAMHGTCIGVTLSTELKSYLIWKTNIISEDEHLKNIDK